MTTFDQRERAFETKFVHEQDLNFRARAVRNRRIALWAAEQLRMSPEARSGYAAEIVRCGAIEGDEAVFQRLRGDFSMAEFIVSDHRLRRTMEVWLADARVAQCSAATQFRSGAGRKRMATRSPVEDPPEFSLLREYFSKNSASAGAAQISAMIATATFLSLAYGAILICNTLSISGTYDSNLELGSGALALASVAATVWARRSRP